MKKTFLLQITIPLVFCVFIGTAFSEDTQTDSLWNLSGSNMARYEWYKNKGNASSSPYQFEGDQFHNDMFINLSRRFSAYELMDIRLNGTYNESDYRGKKGGVLEGGALLWEKGDSPVPFRLTAGDFFASQTDRSVQRALKGGFLELQPSFSRRGSFHSLQLFSGFSAPTYHEFDAGEDYYNGASWLMEDERFGDLLLSMSHNYRQADEELSLSKRTQTTLSAAYERDLFLVGQDLTLELEYDYFYGDLSSAGPDNDDSKNENGMYAKLYGKTAALPLRYQISYEQYGPDFQPNGAVVGSDQRRYNGNASWRFDNGSTVEGSYQRYEDGVESTNPTDTDTYGLRYTGPLLRGHIKGATFYIDTFSSMAKSDDGSVNTDTYSAQGRISVPVIEGLTSSISGATRKVVNRVADQDTSDHQATLSLIKQVSYRRIKGSITPSWTVRIVTGPSRDQDSHLPSLAVTLSYMNHSLGFSHGYNFQDVRETSGTDVTTQRTSLSYAYQSGPHAVSLYSDRMERDPEPGEGTRAYRVGALYTFSFDTLLGRAERPRRSAAVSAPLSGPLTFASLPPGSSVEEARKLLSASGAVGPIVQGDLMIYEVNIFDDLRKGQRLVVRQRNDRVISSWLITDGDRTIDHVELRDTYREIRSEMIKLLGQPSEVLEKGEFTASVREDITSRTFVRIMEWNTVSGVIRLGIPERLDGRIRVEIVYSGSRTAPLKNPVWGLEQVQ